MKRNILILILTLYSFSACINIKKQESAQKALEPQKTEKVLQTDASGNEKSKIAAPLPISKATIQQLKDILPKEYQIVLSDEEPNIVQGDLNSDDLMDFVVLVEKKMKHDDDHENDVVKIMIYEGTKNQQYENTAQSGNLTSAFIYNNPQPITIINKNIIRAFHQSMRHHFELKFRFQKDLGDYMLIGSEYDNYGSGNMQGAGIISTNFLTGDRVENLKDFDESEQEVFSLPEKITRFNRPLVAINEVSFENVYDLLTGGNL